MDNKNYFIHKSSYADDGCIIGDSTKIWHFSHVQAGAQIGKGCTLGQNVNIASNVIIGDGVKIQNNVSVYNGVTIGKNVFIGPGVTFTNDLYPDVNNWNEEKIVPTFVKDNVSIGANSTIICGITLSENCLIGAGSVVTKNIESNMIAMGNPATEIKNRES